jgi:phosphoglycerate kinase
VALRTLDDLGDITGSRVFVRVDFNVHLDGERVADDLRIRAAIPTLRELRERGAALVVASHLGRPGGELREDLRLAPVADRLGELLEVEVMALDEIVGDGPEAVCAHIEQGDVVLLENLRFDPGEEANDVRFAGRLAELADAFVDDAFGAVHRAHASVVALPELMRASGRPTAAGRLLQREVDVLGRLLAEPDLPYVAVLGGVKVSDKLRVLGALAERADALLIGGAMAFTLIAADGGQIGDSLVERDRFEEVRGVMHGTGEALIELPQDVVAATEASADVRPQTVPAREIPRGLKGLDIGPRTVEEFARILADAKTILWNGPMGVFELEPFSAGTRGVAVAIAGAAAFSVVGGGDSLLAVRREGLEESFDHLSTGGGASLEFLEGTPLPGIAVLES